MPGQAHQAGMQLSDDSLSNRQSMLIRKRRCDEDARGGGTAFGLGRVSVRAGGGRGARSALPLALAPAPSFPAAQGAEMMAEGEQPLARQRQTLGLKPGARLP